MILDIIRLSALLNVFVLTSRGRLGMEICVDSRGNRFIRV